MLEIRVFPEVSIGLGNYLPRECMNVVLMRLRDQLKNNLARYKSRRDPEDEALFDYVLHAFDGEFWHTLRFSVDDCMATDHLFVVAVGHQKGKVRF